MSSQDGMGQRSSFMPFHKDIHSNQKGGALMTFTFQTLYFSIPLATESSMREFQESIHIQVTETILMV